MPETQQIAPVTAEQYRALQRPVIELPTTQQLFDFQVERLVVKGLARYADADPLRKDLPSGLFLFVPRRTANIDWNQLLPLVEYDGKSGRNFLDPQYLADEAKVPEGPYLMLDVEDGYGRRNVTPAKNLANILAEGRSPYITFEGVIHGIVFPDVFATHNMDLVGSRYVTDRRPCLYLNGGQPRLNARWYDHALPKWGTPSCRSRIGA